MQRMTPLMEAKLTNIEANDNLEAALDDKEKLESVNIAIADLPENLKTLLILCTIENMSQKQAADILKISTKGGETRIYRARSALRNKVSGQFMK